MITKKNNRIPVYIVDEHNESFYCWHKEKNKNNINEPLDILHLDAHSDMGTPNTLSKSIYIPKNKYADYAGYYNDFIRGDMQIDIGSFILPAILGGIVKNAYFVFPKWRKIKPEDHKMIVYSVFGEGKIIKCEKSSEPPIKNKMFTKAFPDIKHFDSHICDMDHIPQNKKVLLDIDLDYFACRDSVGNELFHTIEITRGQYLKRELLSKNKYLLYDNIKLEFSKDNGRYIVVVSHKKSRVKEYFQDTEAINGEINRIFDTLKNKAINPAIITISRSCYSGYCPMKFSKTIEKMIIKKITNEYSVLLI